jgi:hypothetical protein
MLRLKGIKMMAFNVRFKTNVSIPDYVGLGQKCQPWLWHRARSEEQERVRYYF